MADPLAEALERNYHEVAEQAVNRTYEQGVGSTDMGEVTQAVPAVHAYIDITDGKKICPHTHEFALEASSDHGYRAMIRAIKPLALTMLDLKTDRTLVESARRYFESGEYFFRK